MKGSQEITFVGGINTDDDVRFVSQGDYRSSMYTRSGSSESQNAGALESMPGNVIIENENLPSGINTVIGSAKWLENESIIYFVYNTNGYNTIWYYSITTQAITQVIGNITDGYAGTALNLDPEYKIFHANVVDNILYWTDGLNPPRKLDLYQAIKYTESDGLDPDGYPFLAFSSEYIASYTMDVVKAPPTFIIQAEYQTNQEKNFNKLYGNQYQFRYQYVYENNEVSKWSMISKQPFPELREFVSGRNTFDSLRDNEIELTYFTGSYTVKQINFAFRRGENGSWLVFNQLDLKNEGVPNATINTLIFDDNVAPQGATLTDILYDNVPQTALCQDILPNQSLAYGNFYADYDLLPQIDIQGERYLTQISAYNSQTTKNYALLNINEDESLSCRAVFSGQANYLSVFYDPGDVLIFTLAPVSQNYNPNWKNYYYVLTEDDFYQDNTVWYNYAQLTLNIKQDFDIRYPELNTERYANSAMDLNILSFPNYKCELLANDPYESEIVTGVGVTKSYKNNYCTKSLKKGSKKVFGIQYYDRANRSNAVQTSPEMIIDVPIPGKDTIKTSLNIGNGSYVVNPKFTINHLPPDWATHYSILVKKDELISSFMQTTATGYSYPPNTVNVIEIQLDRSPQSSEIQFYTTSYPGATFSHTPSKGDRLRFLTCEIVKNTIEYPNQYISNYIELEVLKYNPETNSVWVNDFDYVTRVGNSSGGVGALIEIYTPKRDTAEDVWFEIETFPIYTGNDGIKYHQANDQFQTNDQPAILTSDYGDVFYRIRQYATGMISNVYEDYNNMLEDPQNTQVLNSWSFTNNTLDVYSFTQWYNIIYSETFYLYAPIIKYRYYFIEDYNYSDYYVSNGHGRGRIGIENNKTRRTHYKTGVIHSAPYVMASFINGLSSFDTLGNAEYLDDTFGPINRLKTVGYTLKALQNRKETSIYIQRAYATSADGSGQLAYTSKTFGGINPSETLFGCIHPGSVQVIENDMYYYDFYTGAIIRSSANGQYDVTSGKYKFNYWISTKTNDITKKETKTLYGKTYRAVYTPIALVDEQNTEYTLNFVKTYVLDKRFPNLPIEVYDSNIGPTFNYSEDRWKMFVEYDLYWAENLGINVFSFNGADLYVHNVSQLADETPNELTFYREQKTMSVEFVMNDSAILIKRPLSIGLRSNKVFSVPSITTQASASYPAMKSMLYPNSFKLKEGYWWSAYLRDMNSPNKTEEQGLINGRELRGYAIIHKAEYSSNEKAVLFDVKCSYIGSEALI
jgi:hypothetical protein